MRDPFTMSNFGFFDIFYSQDSTLGMLEMVPLWNLLSTWSWEGSDISAFNHFENWIQGLCNWPSSVYLAKSHFIIIFLQSAVWWLLFLKGFFSVRKWGWIPMFLLRYSVLAIASPKHWLLVSSPWLFSFAFLQVVAQGAISAPMFSTKGPSMVRSTYPTAFPLKHQQKVCYLPIS